MNCFAVPPLRISFKRYVMDSTGSRVLVCSEDTECPMRYNERLVESEPSFCCPNCGRLGLRMVEATPEQCGL